MLELNKELTERLVKISTDGGFSTFLNGTSLSNDQALKVHTLLLDVLKRGESYRQERILREKESFDFVQGSIWSKEDEEFFKEADITPYQFRDHRTILSKLVSRQRSNRFKMKVVTTDAESYSRHRAGLNDFLEQHLNEFSSYDEAVKYYEEMGDDKFAAAISAYMHHVRYQNKAKYAESDCFENGLITGLHFLKAVYSRDVYTNGGITIKSVPSRSVIFDESSVEYDLSDIEFIGEVKEMYVSQLIAEFPQYAEQLYALYKDRTQAIDEKVNTRKYDRYGMHSDNGIGAGIKVCTMYTLNLEERVRVIDKETGEERVADFGQTMETIKDTLAAFYLSEHADRVKAENPDNFDPEYFKNQELEVKIRTDIDDRFDFSTTYLPIWYHSVFTNEGLLAHDRSIYPHGSHPYARFTPIYNFGASSSFMDELKDVIIGLNKAHMFREIMLAHGAKNMVVVNKSVLEQSELTEDDIATKWTSFGSVIALKLKPGQRLGDAFQSVTTVGSGLAEIERVIQSYENKLRFISGVTWEQFGQTGAETPTGRYKIQLQQSNENNGVIFDNFIRTIETFYNDKVVPLCAEDFKLRRTQVIRMIGQQHSGWIGVDVDETYGVFEKSIRAGEYGTVIVPDDEDPQLRNARSAQLMQLAMATGDMGMYAMAIKFSDDPNKHEIVKEINRISKQRAMESLQNQIDMQTIQQIVLESGIPVESAEKIVREMQLAKLKQSQNAQKQNPAAQGAPAIQSAAKDTQRLNSIEAGK